MADIKEFKFLATEEKWEVSALLNRPEGAHALLVLGHGASSNMRHRLVSEASEYLAEAGIATFRYNFPYSEKGGGRNSNTTLFETIRSAITMASAEAPDLPHFAGGHSMSGRMTSMTASESPLQDVRGLVFLAFPLHPAGKRGTERAEHLANVTVPMLFLSGTRDKLAELDLLEPTCEDLGKQATLHLVDTADHSFKELKRSRATEEPPLVEVARVASEWMRRKSK